MSDLVTMTTTPKYPRKVTCHRCKRRFRTNVRDRGQRIYCRQCEDVLLDIRLTLDRMTQWERVKAAFGWRPQP